MTDFIALYDICRISQTVTNSDGLISYFTTFNTISDQKSGYLSTQSVRISLANNREADCGLESATLTR